MTPNVTPGYVCGQVFNPQNWANGALAALHCMPLIKHIPFIQSLWEKKVATFESSPEQKAEISTDVTDLLNTININFEALLNTEPESK